MDGHVDRRVLRCLKGDMRRLTRRLSYTLAQHNTFMYMLAGTMQPDRPKRARTECVLHKLQGQELVLSLVADFVGVVRGRALRNAREAL
jgi:hypothetical protein